MKGNARYEITNHHQSSGTPVLIVANPSALDRQAHIKLTGLPANAYLVKAFVVRTDHTPEEATVETPLFDRTLDIPASGATLDVPAGAHNVVGIRLEAGEQK